jgi:hypothetical protein
LVAAPSVVIVVRENKWRMSVPWRRPADEARLNVETKTSAAPADKRVEIFLEFCIERIYDFEAW